MVRNAKGQFTPGNFEGTGSLGYAVGNPEFLNSEASKVARYWRLIEQGSEGNVGRKLGGLWASVVGAPGARITGELTKFGEGTQQQFVPFSADETSRAGVLKGAIAALAYLEAQGSLAYEGYSDKQMFFLQRRRLLEGATSGPTLGTVKEAMVAQLAYTEGSKKFEPAQREMEAIDEAFKHTNIYNSETNRAKNVLAFRKKGLRKAPTIAKSETFVRRTGMLSGYALSDSNRSLAQVEPVFRAELTQVNRVLAEELAKTIAEVQQEKILRDPVQSRALEAATLAAENRFPR